MKKFFELTFCQRISRFQGEETLELSTTTIECCLESSKGSSKELREMVFYFQSNCETTFSTAKNALSLQ